MWDSGEIVSLINLVHNAVRVKKTTRDPPRSLLAGGEAHIFNLGYPGPYHTDTRADLLRRRRQGAVVVRA